MRLGIEARVCVDIPDKDDPDYSLHRSEGEVIDVIEDDASSSTGDERDSVIYRVELENGERRDFR